MRKLLSIIAAGLLLLSSARAQLTVNELYGFGTVPPSAAVSLAIADTNTSNNDTVSNPNVVNLPPNISSGDLLLLFYGVNGTTVTDPAGWTVIINSSGNDNLKLYAKIATGSEGATVSITNSTNERFVANAYRITGARNGVTSSEIAVSTNSSGSTNTPDPPSLTPSWGSAENLWFAVVQNNFGGSNTVSAYPTNYSLGQINTSNATTTAGTTVSTAARLFTGTSDDPGTFTWGTSRNYTGWTVAVRPQ